MVKVDKYIEKRRCCNGHGPERKLTTTKAVYCMPDYPKPARTGVPPMSRSDVTPVFRPPSCRIRQRLVPSWLYSSTRHLLVVLVSFFVGYPDVDYLGLVQTSQPSTCQLLHSPSFSEPEFSHRLNSQVYCFVVVSPRFSFCTCP